MMVLLSYGISISKSLKLKLKKIKLWFVLKIFDIWRKRQPHPKIFPVQIHIICFFNVSDESLQIFNMK